MENPIDPKKPFGKYVDDFLPGSYIYFNILPDSYKNYLQYVQLVGSQRIGQSYYNEVRGFPEYMLCYTASGHGDCEIEGEHRILGKGDLVFMKCFYHRTLKAVRGEPWTIYFVHLFTNDFITEVAQEFYRRHGFVLSGVPESLVAPRVERIYSLFNEKKKRPDLDTKVSQEVYALLTDIVAFSAEGTYPHLGRKTTEIIRYIESMYRYGITVKSVVSFSGYSKNYMEEVFKANTGVTISEYLFNIRLGHAKELLLTTDLSYSEIAEQVGLSEYRSLYRMFIKATGKTPGAYKKAERAKV